VPPKYSIALALHCVFRLPHAPLARPPVPDRGPAAPPPFGVFDDLNPMEDIMTEEQHIIRARAEEDRWEEIERLFGSWADDFDADEEEPDLDPELEELISALGY